jgi:hypothetical protein
MKQEKLEITEHVLSELPLDMKTGSEATGLSESEATGLSEEELMKLQEEPNQ